MEEFDDIEYVALKALSEKVISGVSPAILKVTKDGEKLAEEITEIETKLAGTTDIKEIARLSKISEDKREELLHILAIKNRLDELTCRNKTRIEYFNQILKQQGIYEENIDKKKLTGYEDIGLEDVSEKTLNLNKTLSSPVPKYVLGRLLYFRGKALDFSLPENKNIMISANGDFIRDILSMYPRSISTISAEELAHSKLKNQLLKELTYYVGENLRHKSIMKINDELGELLSFKTEICGGLDDYIAGVENSFNVQVKRYFRERFPDRIEEINEKLKCNEDSLLLHEPGYQEPKTETEQVQVEVEIEPETDVEDDNQEVITEELANGSVRKSMISKELTDAFTDPDMPKEETSENSSDEVDFSEMDKDILELYGISIPDDDEEGE